MHRRIVASLSLLVCAVSGLRTPLLSRRTALVAAAGIGGPFVVATAPPAEAANPTREGMAAFSANRVEESIEIFDSVIAEKPATKPYLWQRGLSLYYADRFEDGAEQFAADVAVNPNDTEETIWHLLCLAQLAPGGASPAGLSAARTKMLKVGAERRPVMRAALDLFAGKTDEAPLQAFASSESSAADIFYGNLYLGLYREALGDAKSARSFMTAAVDSRYGQLSGDYMADLAKVHLKRRRWSAAKGEL